MRLTLQIIVCALIVSCAEAQPWQPQVIWDRSGAGDSSLYGYKILPLGDQNEDGFADWAVFAAGTIYGGTQQPYLEFFHGGNPPSNMPYRTLRGLAGQYSLIFADVAGDPNGDGFTDWFTFVRTVADPSIYQVRVYFGGAGADTLPDLTFTTDLHSGVTGMGDFNGDGFGDLYVDHNDGAYGEILFGGSAMDTLSDWTLHSPQGTQMALLRALGDLNGDGHSDFVSTDLSGHTTFIFLGGADPDTVPAYTWPDLPYWPQGIVRDLNGDDYDELVFHASEQAPLCWGGPILHSEPDVTLSFPCGMSSPDEAVGVGDINHDGFNDLVLVSGYCESSWWGVLSLYLGHPWLNPQPVWTIQGRGWQNLVSLQTAAGLGDVNGDGVDDFAIGAWDDLDLEGWRGRSIVVAGDTSLIAGVDGHRPEIPHELQVVAYPNPLNSTTTIELSLPLTSAPLELTLYNTLGQIAYHETLQPTASTLRHTLSAEGLASGVYVLACRAAEFRKNAKLVVMK